jgi:hypothetical protein
MPGILSQLTACQAILFQHIITHAILSQQNVYHAVLSQLLVYMYNTLTRPKPLCAMLFCPYSLHAFPTYYTPLYPVLTYYCIAIKLFCSKHSMLRYPFPTQCMPCHSIAKHCMPRHSILSQPTFYHVILFQCIVCHAISS